MESKVVAAVGASGNSIALGGRQMAAEIERAMSNAVLAASENGISDPEKVKQLMLAARDAVKMKWAVADSSKGG